MTLLWDVRTQMEQNEAKMVESIISQNEDKKRYFILKHSNWDPANKDVLKTTYMLRSTKPPKMLGTILWEVDNINGKLIRHWDLPLDVNVDPLYLNDGIAQEQVHHSMQDIKPAIVIS